MKFIETFSCLLNIHSSFMLSMPCQLPATDWRKIKSPSSQQILLLVCNLKLINNLWDCISSQLASSGDFFSLSRHLHLVWFEEIASAIDDRKSRFITASTFRNVFFRCGKIDRVCAIMTSGSWPAREEWCLSGEIEFRERTMSRQYYSTSQ